MSDMLSTEDAVQASTETVIEKPAVAENATTGFIDSLPEDIRGESSLQDFKDVGSLAKSYVNAQALIGKSIRIPGEDASVEVKEDFYKKLTSVPGVLKMPADGDTKALSELYQRLGAPEAADGYTVDVPDGIGIDAQGLQQFKEYAHQLGLSKKQFKEVLDFRITEMQQQQSQVQDYVQHSTATLKDTFGQEFDNKIKVANSTLNYYEQKFPDAVQTIKTNPLLANNPVLISLLAEVGTSFGEKGSVKGFVSPQIGLTPADAREKINEIRANKLHPFNVASDPGHKEAVIKMNELYEIIASSRD